MDYLASMYKNEMDSYEQGWVDGVKECLKLAESIGDTYMIDCLKEWLRYD